MSLFVVVHYQISLIQAIISTKQSSFRLNLEKYARLAMLAAAPLQAITASLDAQNLNKDESTQKNSISWSPLGIGITDLCIAFAELLISPSIAIDSLLSMILNFGMISPDLRDLFNRLHLGQFLTYVGLAVRADGKLENELLQKSTFSEKLKFEFQQYIKFPSRLLNGIKDSPQLLTHLISKPKEFLPKLSSNLLFMKAFLGPIAGLSLVISYFYQKQKKDETQCKRKEELKTQLIERTKKLSTLSSNPKEADTDPSNVKNLMNCLENCGWFISKSLYWLMSISWMAKAFNSDYSIQRRISSTFAGLFEGLHSTFLSNPYLANFFRSGSRISRTVTGYLEQLSQMGKR